MPQPVQLSVLVDELLEAHEDTVKLAFELAPAELRWEAHLAYLQGLVSFGRTTLVEASDCGMAGRRSRLRPKTPTKRSRRCARNGHGKGSA